MMKQDTITVILKGMWVGGTMTVPGVSGGSMAMIAGIYAEPDPGSGNVFCRSGEAWYLSGKIPFRSCSRHSAVFKADNIPPGFRSQRTPAFFLFGSSGRRNPYDL